MNRLAEATSPYLLQHADNPVDWYQWGEAAFAEARRRDVPVLLSVGYSSCHWCHVMAHESFEDEVTADEMNRLFVNIKVDREERPDVDSIYMEALQAMTGQGGWPMTVWLTPAGEPFFAGTYFPRVNRGGMASFRQVMAAVDDAWRSRRGDLTEQATRVMEALREEVQPGSGLPSLEQLESAIDNLSSSFDERRGGFGQAPKFPQQPLLEFLLRSSVFSPRSQQMLSATLEAMARGGIFDQLGGGFSRYSVDEAWVVPHFEKMLYDNAQLIRLYLWTGLEAGRADLVDTARRTIDYLIRDLRHPDGGFYSAEDADSEGVEGKFYVWGFDEFMDVCGPDAAVAARAFGVTTEGNFEGDNILVAALEPDDLRGEFPDVDTEAALARSRQALLERRAVRIRPGLDDKVVAAWNGLAIRALAEAGAALSEPGYLEAAKAAAQFVLERMAESGLKRTWAKGTPGSVDGFLDDYAALGLGLLSLFAATGETGWYSAAEELIRSIPVRFEDADGTLFSATAGDLFKRPRDLFDNPSPSGTSLAAEAMLWLSLYTGETDLRERAQGYLQQQAALFSRYPSGAGYGLAVATSLQLGTKELAVVGHDRVRLSEVYWKRSRPHIVLAQSDDPVSSVPLLVNRPGAPGGLAYVCSGMVCLAPTASPSELELLLDNS